MHNILLLFFRYCGAESKNISIDKKIKLGGLGGRENPIYVYESGEIVLYMKGVGADHELLLSPSPIFMYKFYNVQRSDDAHNNV